MQPVWPRVDCLLSTWQYEEKMEKEKLQTAYLITPACNRSGPASTVYAVAGNTMHDRPPRAGGDETQCGRHHTCIHRFHGRSCCFPDSGSGLCSNPTHRFHYEHTAPDITSHPPRLELVQPLTRSSQHVCRRREPGWQGCEAARLRGCEIVRLRR